MNSVVITPTILKPFILDAIESVKNQTIPTKHLVVVDGTDKLLSDPKKAKIFDIIDEMATDNDNLEIVCLPTNVGGNGFYGHRIYAAFPHLVNEDYVLFLDEDNWYKPDHVNSLIQTIKSDNPEYGFAYSLRDIYNVTREFVISDNCESLGVHPVWSSNQHFHVDTSAYCFKREFITQVAHIWHYGYAGDRRFFHAVIQNKHTTSGKHTLCYRLDGNPNSVTKQFFEQGNSVMKKEYPNGFPWVK